MTEWRLNISDRTDKRVRDYLAQQGQSASDFSQAVEHLVDSALSQFDLLKAEVQKGFDDLEAGRFVELKDREAIQAHGEKIRQEGRKRLEQAG